MNGTVKYNRRKIWHWIHFLAVINVVNSSLSSQWISVNDSLLFFSKNLVDADEANTICGNSQSHLAKLDNSLIKLRAYRFLNEAWNVKDLQSVYVFVDGDRFVYSLSLNNVKASWKPYDEVSMFYMYREPNEYFEQIAWFCKSEVNISRGIDTKWLLHNSRCESQQNKWIPQFHFYGGNISTPGTTSLFNFFNKSLGTKLSMNSSLLDDIYPTENPTLYAPRIEIWVGARSEIGEVFWRWSDNSISDPKLFPSTAANECLQMLLQFADGWIFTAKSCKEYQATFLCQYKFDVNAVVKANHFESANVRITWNPVRHPTLLSNESFVEVQVENNKFETVNFSTGFLEMPPLELQEKFNATVLVNIGNRTALRKSLQIVSKYKRPLPVRNAQAVRLKDGCTIQWNHVQSEVIAYKVQILGSNENKTGKVLPATKVGERLGMAIPESWNAKSRCPTFTIASYSHLGRSEESIVFGNCADEIWAVGFFIFVFCEILLLSIVLWKTFKEYLKEKEKAFNTGSFRIPNMNEHKWLKARFNKLNPIESLASPNTRATIVFKLNKKRYTCFPVNTSIDIRHFGTFFKLASANNFEMLRHQYQTIETFQLDKPFDTSQQYFNIIKNRYIDVYSFDDSRVVLTGGPEEDYVNASFIKGYRNNRLFIVSQGPMSNTVDDFWRMIWEQKCAIIVMLCNTIEGFRPKCHQYWPPRNMAWVFDNYKIFGENEEEGGPITKRTFRMTDLTTEEERVVTQFHYLEWEDHDVPDRIQPLVILRHMVNSHHASQKDTPLVVHCSAGVGRSGTYIAMDILFDQIDDVGKVNVVKCVLEMREARTKMVQTEGQYIFVYRLALWYIQNRHRQPVSSLLAFPRVISSSMLPDTRIRRQTDILPLTVPGDVSPVYYSSRESLFKAPEKEKKKKNIISPSFYLSSVFQMNREMPRPPIFPVVPNPQQPQQDKPKEFQLLSAKKVLEMQNIAAKNEASKSFFSYKFRSSHDAVGDESNEFHSSMNVLYEQPTASTRKFQQKKDFDDDLYLISVSDSSSSTLKLSNIEFNFPN